MRIGLFTDYFLPHTGGTELSVFHQRRALEAAGHTTYIIAPPMRGKQSIDDRQEHVVRLPNYLLQLWHDEMGIYIGNPHAFTILDQLQLDIVHAQTEFGIGILAHKYAIARRLPQLYTAHTFLTTQIELLHRHAWLASLGPLALHRLAMGPTKYKFKKPVQHFEGVPCTTAAQRNILRYWLGYARTADHILTPSHRMYDLLHYYLPQQAISVVPNPFRLANDLPPAPVLAQPSKVTFVWAGRLTNDKRPQPFIDAILQLPADIKQQLRVVVFGDGNLFSRIKRQIANADAGEIIHLHGAVDNRVVQAALQRADVSISSSLGFDNQPMTVLEALHSGVAILYCDKGLREGLTEQNSVLCAPTVEGFRQAITALTTHSQQLAAMKRASLQLAKSFSYETFAQHYQKILASVKP